MKGTAESLQKQVSEVNKGLSLLWFVVVAMVMILVLLGILAAFPMPETFRTGAFCLLGGVFLFLLFYALFQAQKHPEKFMYTRQEFYGQWREQFSDSRHQAPYLPGARLTDNTTALLDDTPTTPDDEPDA